MPVAAILRQAVISFRSNNAIIPLKSVSKQHLALVFSGYFLNSYAKLQILVATSKILSP